MNKELSRDNSIKIATMSFIAAIMVVFIHIPHADCGSWTLGLENLISHDICSVAVPFFFVLSGYFIARHTRDDGWWPNALKKRAHSILIPFLIWVTITTLICLPLVVLANHAAQHPLDRNLFLFYPWTVYGLNPFQQPPTPYWYLRELLIFTILSPIVNFVISKGRWSAVSTLVAVFTANLIISDTVPQASPYKNFFDFFICMRGMFYFSGGFFLCHYPIIIKHAKIVGIILILAPGFLMVRKYFCEFGILAELSTTLLLSGWWLVQPSFKLPTVLNNMSFPIYVMHYLFVLILVVPFGHLFPKFRQSLVAYITSTILVVSFCVIVATMLRRKFPGLAKLLFGGR